MIFVDEGVYQAESPDELALVQAAESVGVALSGRRRSSEGLGDVLSVNNTVTGADAFPSQTSWEGSMGNLNLHFRSITRDTIGEYQEYLERRVGMYRIL